MEHTLLLYKDSQISYYCFGAGPNTAVCFHGYGEESAMFEFFGKYAGEQFTFYAIDLPFHGQTQWNEGLNFNWKDLQEIISMILQKDSNQTTANSQLTLLGFSLGGRIALSLYLTMPEQIKKLVLLAPDGLKVNFWYWLSTQTWLGNKLFALTMKHPGWFFGFLKALNKLGVVNASIFKFVNYYIGDKEVRRLLYERWTTLRKIKPDPRLVKSFVVKYKTPVRLIYGKHDRIILSAVGEKFKKGIEEYCSLTVVESGHQVLHEKHAAEILPLLFD